MPVRVGIAKLTQCGDIILERLNSAPDAVEKGGLKKVLETNGCIVVESKTAELTNEEENQYGAWNRLGLASRHLADIVADQVRRGMFTIGLLPTCDALMGMLGGFQRSGPKARPLRVGLIWLDAHGDINTPETTPSGLLAGMPLAIAAGLCLERLRVMCGQEVAIPTKCIKMVGVRDADPLEQEIINNSDIEQITSDDIRELSPVITQQMERLGKITDIIYVHVDIDVLDPKETPGLGLPVEGGPTSAQLGAAFEIVFRYPKVAGLGIASHPVGRDSEGKTLMAIYELIRHAVIGVNARNS
ncbi:MAG: arginase family protein [Candidatus Odinarchaeota archaeon]